MDSATSLLQNTTSELCKFVDPSIANKLYELQNKLNDGNNWNENQNIINNKNGKIYLKADESDYDFIWIRNQMINIKMSKNISRINKQKIEFWIVSLLSSQVEWVSNKFRVFQMDERHSNEFKCNFMDLLNKNELNHHLNDIRGWIRIVPRNQS